MSKVPNRTSVSFSNPASPKNLARFIIMITTNK
ncbi:Uncharacterised protein [Vibrio cholerae]|nr:Uncharacterised protein [Vibrio cholerae]